MFHVPEASRIREGEMGSDSSLGNNGAFEVPSPEPGWTLYLVCSDSKGPERNTLKPEELDWEHVSVTVRRHRKLRLPTWKEMCFAKDLCWDPEDVVMQLHPRQSDYVNRHPTCLHLWRPIAREIPTPPRSLVG